LGPLQKVCFEKPFFLDANWGTHVGLKVPAFFLSTLKGFTKRGFDFWGDVYNSPQKTGDFFGSNSSVFFERGLPKIGVSPTGEQGGGFWGNPSFSGG